MQQQITRHLNNLRLRSQHILLNQQLRDTSPPAYQLNPHLIRPTTHKQAKQQYSIDPELRTPQILTNKVVTACQGVPAYQIAISNPSKDLATLINKLQSFIVA
jgi:hypothetical protein